MERALQFFSLRPTCRPPNMTTYLVRMEIGLQVRLASVCQMFSGSSSEVSFVHAHQKATHKRGIFLDMLSRVCGHLLEYPMVVLAKNLNQTAFLLAFQDDFDTANFPCQARSSQVLLLEQLFLAFLVTVGNWNFYPG